MPNKRRITIHNDHLSKDTTALYKYCIEFYQDAAKFLRAQLIFYWMDHAKVFTDHYLMKTLRNKFNEENHMMEFIPHEIVDFAFEQFLERKHEVEASLKKALYKSGSSQQAFLEVENLFTMKFTEADIVANFMPYKTSKAA